MLSLICFTVPSRLYLDNKKVDCTDPFTIQANAKIVDLTQVKALNFDTKDETVKYPIFVYVLYG